MKKQHFTDIELIDRYCVECRDFVDPFLTREISDRGLIQIINHLPSNVDERKAVARARLAKIGKSFGDVEIDQIAGAIQRVEWLRSQLSTMNMADAHKVLPILEEMTEHSTFIRDYYKEVKV